MVIGFKNWLENEKNFALQVFYEVFLGLSRRKEERNSFGMKIFALWAFYEISMLSLKKITTQVQLRRGFAEKRPTNQNPPFARRQSQNHSSPPSTATAG
jgi:hypothetical protein